VPTCRLSLPGGSFYSLAPNREYGIHGKGITLGKPALIWVPYTSAIDPSTCPILACTQAGALHFVQSRSRIYHPPDFLSPIPSAFGVLGPLLCRPGPALPMSRAGWVGGGSFPLEQLHLFSLISTVPYLHAVCCHPLELDFLFT